MISPLSRSLAFLPVLAMTASLASAATTSGSTTTTTTTVQSSSTILGVGTKKPGPGNPKKNCPGTVWQLVDLGGGNLMCVKSYPSSP